MDAGNSQILLENGNLLRVDFVALIAAAHCVKTLKVYKSESTPKVKVILHVYRTVPYIYSIPCSLYGCELEERLIMA